MSETETPPTITLPAAGAGERLAAAVDRVVDNALAKQTTFLRDAAKVALAAAPRPSKDNQGSVLLNVLVHESMVISTDGRRAVICKAADAGGMFDRGQRVALVPRERLADVVRGKVDHVNVNEHGSLEGFDEDGELIRSCPFSPPPLKDFPDVVKVLENSSRRLVCRFAPRLLGELLMAMANAGCERVALYDAGLTDVALEFRGELDHEVQVSALIARVTTEQDSPLPVPQPVRTTPAEDPATPMGKAETDAAIEKLADAATSKGKRRGKKGGGK